MEDLTSKIGSGSTPKGSNYSKEGIPFFRSQNVYNDGLKFDDIKYISSDIHQSMNGTAVCANDLLLNITGGSIGRCAVVPNDFNTGNVSQHVCIIRPIICLSEYLHAYIISDLFWASMKLTGSGREGLPKYNLEQMCLPLPPLQEQERIIAEIKKWSNVIYTIEDGICQLSDNITTAKAQILELAMQGKLVEQDPSDEPAADMLRRVNPKAKIITDNPHCWNIPTSWVWCQLGDIFQHNTGKALNSSDNEGVEYDYITTSNVYWDRFELDSIKRMKFKDSELDKCSIRCGDLLVCEGGDIGRAAIWNYDVPMMIQNHLHRLRPMATEVSTELYCKVLKLYKDKNLIGGKGIGMLGFSSNALHKLVVPLMAYKEQIKIYSKIIELYNILDEIEASLQS